MFSRAARRVPLGKLAAAGAAAAGASAVACQGGGLEDRVASLEKTVASLVDKLQKAGDQLSSAVVCKGAAHGPWRDDTYSAKNEIHAPRYFSSYDDFGKALENAQGELILKELLTREMYDKYKDVKTSLGVTLDKCIKGGIDKAQLGPDWNVGKVRAAAHWPNTPCTPAPPPARRRTHTVAPPSSFTRPPPGARRWASSSATPSRSRPSRTSCTP